MFTNSEICHGLVHSQDNKLTRYLDHINFLDLCIYESLPVEAAQNSLGGHSTAEVVACELAKTQNYRQIKTIPLTSYSLSDVNLYSKIC